MEIESFEITDCIEIIASNFWGSGKLPSSRQGVLLVEHRWEVDIGIQCNNHPSVYTK